MEKSVMKLAAFLVAGLMLGATAASAEDLDKPRDGGDHRTDLDYEHDRIPNLHARIELAEAVDQRTRDDVLTEQ